MKVLHIALFLGITSFFFISAHPTSSIDSSKSYSLIQLQKDFSYLRKKLENYHPNLYLYTPKGDFDRLFDSIYNSIKGEESELDFYNKICCLNSRIKDGHTYFLPSKLYREKSIQSEKFFPFDIYINNGSLFILKNYSEDSSTIAGTEIISINGISAQKIISNLTFMQVRDGYSLTYPKWILNHYFRGYFSYAFGSPESFKMELKKENIIVQKQIGALSNEQIVKIKKSQNANKKVLKGIDFAIDESGKTATLTIRTFDNSLLKNTYSQNFKKDIKDAFDKIIDLNITNLIIDVRDNQGGDVKNAQFLCSYLIDTRFRLVQKGPGSAWSKPQIKIFRHNLYIMINGGSFSATGMMCSTIRQHKKGIFLGEETGGNKVILSGNAWSYKLPNTHIQCYISKRTYLLNNENNDGHGIVPDYELIPDINDVLSETDIVKYKINELIANK